MTRLALFSLLFLAATAHAAEKPSAEQSVRAIVSNLAQAQTIVLNYPDLLAERDQLQAQVRQLTDEIEKQKAAQPKEGGK